LPVAFVSWARLSEEAEKKFITTQKLSPADWKSGDRLWLVDVVTPFGNQDRIFKELYQSIFKGEEIHMLFPREGGVTQKITINELLKAKESRKEPKQTKH
jgi:cytolysin-activating lysine-acyltransferase